MSKLAVVVASVVVIAFLGSGCGGPGPELKVSYPGGGDRTSFRLVNASGAEWTDVHVLVRGMRPDGIETECAEQRIELWGPGESQTLPRCGDEKTLISIETGGQRAFFVLGGGILFLKIGRKEIPIS